MSMLDSISLVLCLTSDLCHYSKHHWCRQGLQNYRYLWCYVVCVHQYTPIAIKALSTNLKTCLIEQIIFALISHASAVNQSYIAARWHGRREAFERLWHHDSASWQFLAVDGTHFITYRYKPVNPTFCTAATLWTTKVAGVGRLVVATSRGRSIDYVPRPLHRPNTLPAIKLPTLYVKSRLSSSPPYGPFSVFLSPSVTPSAQCRPALDGNKGHAAATGRFDHRLVSVPPPRAPLLVSRLLFPDNGQIRRPRRTHR